MNKKFKKPIYVCQPILPDINKYLKRLKRVWHSRFITNCGKQVEELEDRLADYLKVPSLSLFNNGTSALYSAIRYLRLKGEVITTPFTFASTPHALTLNDITPVFCDIDDKTYNINPDKIEQLITPRTTGILAVHVFGVPCEVEKIKKIADRHNIKVIYDAAHAFGSKINGVGIGNFGDISIFSFHATKSFHTAEGGAVVCKNEEAKTYFDQIRNFGFKNSEELIEPGLNGKLSEIHAALGLEVLPLVKKDRERRKKILSIYKNKLKNIKGIEFNKIDNFNLQYFVIRINEDKFGKSRDEVYDLFKEYNVFTRKYFHPLCSHFPYYKDNDSAREDRLPVANQITKEVLALPFYGKLSITNVNNICDILVSFKR